MTSQEPFDRRRTRRWWYAGMTILAASLLAAFLVSGAAANLTGSTFEGNDGNLAVTTAGNLDWNALNTSGTPKLNIGTEEFSGQQDNSFGQGTKEDDSNVTLVQGSIPPQKSDLTRFYEASEIGTNDHVFLYLAWERTNVLGNANMDFEINKKGTPCLSSGGPFPVKPCVIDRSVGDVLVTYDFGGSGTPTIGIRTWNGSSWQLDNTVVSESAVNSGSVFDSHLSSTNPNLVANTFGEASIDLTASNVVTPGTCDFGSATTFLKSRSSSSFTSEIKDYVKPIATPIVPCKGAINVVKQAKDHNCSAAGASSNTTSTPDATCVAASTRALDGASFSIWQESNGTAGLQTTGTTDTKVGISQSTVLAGSGSAAVASTCFSNLTLGGYYVHEDSAPSGFATASDKTVTVAQGTCASGATPASFTGASADQPLTDLSVTAASVLAGASNSRISCVTGGIAIAGSPAPPDSGGQPQFTDPDTLTSNGLKPGTYTCTVVIDP
jgi:hypothetical protein